MSDFGVISPRSASGAMYAQVPTIRSVIIVVDDLFGDALVSPKSEIFATNLSSNKIFALEEKGFTHVILLMFTVQHSQQNGILVPFNIPVDMVVAVQVLQTSCCPDSY